MTEQVSEIVFKSGPPVLPPKVKYECQGCGQIHDKSSFESSRCAGCRTLQYEQIERLRNASDLGFVQAALRILAQDRIFDELMAQNGWRRAGNLVTDGTHEEVMKY